MTIQLDDLGDRAFWAARSRHGSVPLLVVLPTGRAPATLTPHLPLISDARYSYEAITALNALVSADDLLLEVESTFDIDCFGSDGVDSRLLGASNVLILGDAQVNALTLEILERTESFEIYGVGYMPPYLHTTMRGGDGNMILPTVGPNLGLLAAYANPWSVEPRICLLCSGFLAVGTMAATYLLTEYIKGERRGNNVHVPEAPVKFVEGRTRDYAIKLKAVERSSPPMEIASIAGIVVRD